MNLSIYADYRRYELASSKVDHTQLYDRAPIYVTGMSYVLGHINVESTAQYDVSN